jgi:outer membrane protein OmpA-like peptidoglycan-associated protein
MKLQLLRIAAVVAVAAGASACSSVPDWVDPTSWGDDSASSNAQAPDLADLPSKPTQQTTPDDQKQVADSLSADRTQANYSAQSLRGGTEQAAPAPDTVSPAEQQVSSSGGAPAPAAVEESAPPAEQQAPASEVASNEPAPATSTEQPSVAAAPPPPAPAAMSDSDAALGFHASSAPPLDPSVAQFVPQPVLSRYNQTSGETTPAAEPTASRHSRRHHHSSDAEGGPEAMSGDVVANLDALQPTSSVAYSPASGSSPSAIVFFAGDGTTLNAEGRAKVKEAVASYQSKGSQGFIKVVGHSSSRTPDMPVEQHLALIFQRSQQRANAVAQELIRDGIPADKVLVEAVGDSQPIYYESMPKGEEGNRRAEIFLQG